MAITYTITTQKPSNDDLFWWEFATEDGVFINPALLCYFDGFDGFISRRVLSEITWEEVVSRKGELRPDIRAWLEGANVDNAVPVYNPFENTVSAEFTFNTIENFNQAYDTLFRNSENNERYIGGLWDGLFSNSNNTVVEEVYVDGVKTEFNNRF